MFFAFLVLVAFFRITIFSMFTFSLNSLHLSSPPVVSRKPHKSWTQLRQSVKSAHRRLSEISSKIPFAFNWCPIDDSSVRLYFLSSLDSSPEITLLYCDIDLSPVTPAAQATNDEEALDEQPEDTSENQLTCNDFVKETSDQNEVGST